MDFGHSISLECLISLSGEILFGIILRSISMSKGKKLKRIEESVYGGSKKKSAELVFHPGVSFQRINE